MHTASVPVCTIILFILLFYIIILAVQVIIPRDLWVLPQSGRLSKSVSDQDLKSLLLLFINMDFLVFFVNNLIFSLYFLATSMVMNLILHCSLSSSSSTDCCFQEKNSLLLLLHINFYINACSVVLNQILSSGKQKRIL